MNIHLGQEIDLEILSKHIQSSSCPNPILYYYNNLLHHSYTQHCYFRHHNIDLQPSQGVNIHLGEEIDLEILNRYILNKSCPNPMIHYYNKLLHHSCNQNYCFHHHKIDLQTIVGSHIHWLLVLYPMRFITWINTASENAPKVVWVRILFIVDIPFSAVVLDYFKKVYRVRWSLLFFSQNGKRPTTGIFGL